MKHDAATRGKTPAWLIEATPILAVTLWGGVAVGLFGCGGAAAAATSGVTRCAGAVTEGPTPPIANVLSHEITFHGQTRVDDYFWLREKNDNALHYLQAENAYATEVLAPTDGLRESLFAEIKSRIRETDEEVPVFDRGFYYYSRTVEGAQYPLHCRKRASLDAAEEVLLDLNALAPSYEFVGVGEMEVSDDGNLLAYSLDTTGFRAYTLHVKDLRTGAELLGDGIPDVKSIAWAADNRTLFYAVDDAAKRPYRVFRRVLGEPASVQVFEEPDERFGVGVERSRSRALIILGAHSHTTSEVRFLKADAPTTDWTLVKARVPDVEYEVDHRGDSLFIHSNDTGRNFRLVTAPLTQPSQWTELQATSHEVMLEGVELFASHHVVHEREQGLPRLRIVRKDQSSVTIPVEESVYELWGGDNPDFGASFYRYEYTSLATPRSVIDFELATSTRTTRKQVEVLGGYDASRYVSERIHARASDGTAIPVSLIYRRDLVRDGRAPMWLTGYGAYGYPYPITFSHARLSLLDRGVVYAIAHIRGGSELGKRWHDAGRMQHKMNTFTDFIAVAEHLIAERYTSTPRLVIEGSSAGGLLMGAVTNLRPDLFGAVIADVPFVDVVNTMSDATLPLTVGEYEEWGNPLVAEQYAWIAAYCPYTNISRQAYPAMLVKTSWNDSQVMYWEPAKYVAKLRRHKTDDNPLLLYTNLGGGHGGASGRYDRWREVAFDYAFALWRMGIRE